MAAAVGETELAHEQTPTTQPPSDSPRRQFLRDIGFKWDPFAQPTAEQEYSFVDRDTLQVYPAIESPPLSPRPGDIPGVSAGNYYVDPLYNSRREGSVFDELRAPGHALIYGAPGAGKSTLRLAVDADVRAFPDQTLVVTYEPGRAVESEIDEAMEVAGSAPAARRAAERDAHLRLLAAALAVDLFIQIIEQFNYRQKPPTAAQNRAFCFVVRVIEPRLQPVLERLMRGEDKPDLWGFAWLWRRLDRPIVRPVARTPFMQAWFKTLRRRQKRALEPTPDSAPELWQRALDAARLWNFTHVYLMLDGLDTHWRDADRMFGLLDPLLRLMPLFAEQSVSLKCFLPPELKTRVEAALPGYGVALVEVRAIELKWQPERLRRMLGERFRAGGARRLGIADLMERDMREGIDDRLIEAAQGSPRRLLLILHELIEAHVARGRLEEPITRPEWRRALAVAEQRMQEA